MTLYNRLRQWSIFTWRTILLNFIAIRFETRTVCWRALAVNNPLMAAVMKTWDGASLLHEVASSAVSSSDRYLSGDQSISPGLPNSRLVSLDICPWDLETICRQQKKQEAQLPQRDSASATHVFLGSLTDRALHWPPHLFYNYIIDWLNSYRHYQPKNRATYALFKFNRAFKVIQGHPYWSRQQSRMVCCRNVQLMRTLFQVWRRPSKKRLRISANDLYCQKQELLAYIFVANSMGLRSLVFT